MVSYKYWSASLFRQFDSNRWSGVLKTMREHNITMILLLMSISYKRKVLNICSWLLATICRILLESQFSKRWRTYRWSSRTIIEKNQSNWEQSLYVCNETAHEIDLEHIHIINYLKKFSVLGTLGATTLSKIYRVLQLAKNFQIYLRMEITKPWYQFSTSKRVKYVSIWKWPTLTVVKRRKWLSLSTEIVKLSNWRKERPFQPSFTSGNVFL